MTNTNKLIEIAKACGAAVGECMIYNNDTIMFANVAQLQATIDAVNAQEPASDWQNNPNAEHFKLLVDAAYDKPKMIKSIQGVMDSLPTGANVTKVEYHPPRLKTDAPSNTGDLIRRSDAINEADRWGNIKSLDMHWLRIAINSIPAVNASEPEPGDEDGRASDYTQGLSDGADICANAIRALKGK